MGLQTDAEKTAKISGALGTLRMGLALRVENRNDKDCGHVCLFRQEHADGNGKQNIVQKFVAR